MDADLKELLRQYQTGRVSRYRVWSQIRRWIDPSIVAVFEKLGLAAEQPAKEDFLPLDLAVAPRYSEVDPEGPTNIEEQEVEKYQREVVGENARIELLRTVMKKKEISHLLFLFCGFLLRNLYDSIPVEQVISVLNRAQFDGDGVIYGQNSKRSDWSNKGRKIWKEIYNILEKVCQDQHYVLSKNEVAIIAKLGRNIEIESEMENLPEHFAGEASVEETSVGAVFHSRRRPKNLEPKSSKLSCFQKVVKNLIMLVYQLSLYDPPAGYGATRDDSIDLGLHGPAHDVAALDDFAPVLGDFGQGGEFDVEGFYTPVDNQRFLTRSSRIATISNIIGGYSLTKTLLARCLQTDDLKALETIAKEINALELKIINREGALSEVAEGHPPIAALKTRQASILDQIKVSIFEFDLASHKNPPVDYPKILDRIQRLGGRVETNNNSTWLGLDGQIGQVHNDRLQEIMYQDAEMGQLRSDLIQKRTLQRQLKALETGEDLYQDLADAALLAVLKGRGWQ